MGTAKNYLTVENYIKTMPYNIYIIYYVLSYIAELYIDNSQSVEGPRHRCVIAKQITAIHRHFGLHLAG